MVDEREDIEEAALLRFLEQKLRDGGATATVGHGPPPALPPELRRLHEHRALSLRLRATADALGEPMTREEADAEAERLLQADGGLPLAAFREALDDFGRSSGEGEEE